MSESEEEGGEAESRRTTLQVRGQIDGLASDALITQEAKVGLLLALGDELH